MKRSSQLSEVSKPTARSSAPQKRADAWLTIRSARHNNLKNIDVPIPLGRFVCVTGVSGSGKSSLVTDILYERLARDLNGVENTNPGKHGGIDGMQHLDKVIAIDQSPIGRTPRSNPATYVKVFDEIRDLFARLPDSKVRGYQPARFSFNVATGERGGGRCEACEGNGANRVEMDFLADVWVPCPVCAGRRFSHETLQIHFKGKSTYDVLEMDVQEALQHFEAVPKIRAMLATLHDVGLDYIKLGQSSTTLSGGEAQRIKLARELVRRSTGRTLYILDEPTTGLHFDDIRRLLAVLHGFVDAGNTVVVIEHNLDVIKTADWVIDLGPEGGDEGGHIVVAGTPEDVAACERSYTGQALRPVLKINAETSKRRNAEIGKHRNTETPKSENVETANAHRLEPFSRDFQPSSHEVQQSSRELQPSSRDPTGSASAARDEILIVGAREHNLKNLTVSVPRGRMTVCSGVSGSGKTSFAIDTVYTEGHRRYVESLSAYARQFLGQMQKPKVDHVYGLSPAIAIEQKAASVSPRSTVGTVTEIYDYLRVLWARVGQPYCPRCSVPVGTQTSDEIVDRIMAIGEDSRLMLCAPIERDPGETWETLVARCRSQGYVRVRVDGRVFDVSDELRVDVRQRHSVELVVDRIVVRASARSRVTDSVEHCLALGKGLMLAVPAGDEETPKRRNAETPKEENAETGLAADVMRFSQHLSCESCGASYEELTPHHFSFNSRLGWCPSCEGLGVQRGTRAETIIVRPDESILSGGIAGWHDVEQRPLLRAMLVALAGAIGFEPNTPCSQLTAEQRHALLFGLGERWIEGETPKGENAETPKSQRDKKSQSQNAGPHDYTPTAALRLQWKGFFPAIDEATRVSWEYRTKFQELATEVPCQACGGGRIRPEARSVRLGPAGAFGRTIVDVCSMSLEDAAKLFDGLKLDRHRAKISGELLHEIKSRLHFLLDVGLGYLTLGRAAPTLSGGESQRIRLASQIGSGLTGVLYVLDEPTIGLHPRDNRRLIAALHKLRDLGNTLLLVEHDREILSAADHLIDFGPGAGALGGHVVAAASPTELKRRNAETPKRRKEETSKRQKGKKAECGNAEAPVAIGDSAEAGLADAGESLTARYLVGVEAMPVPTNRRGVSGAPGLGRGVAGRAGAAEKELTYASDDYSSSERGTSLRGYPPAKAGGSSTAGGSTKAGGSSEQRWLVVRGARQNNLRAIDVAFPLGRFICVTGVSGSGKSSLISEILYPALAARIHRARLTPGAHDGIDGLDHIDKVINVDQQPIGNSPWSNPATYTGVFDIIREVFARLPDSRIRGYTANRFSFMRPGGRCEDCDGFGQVGYEMHFLPDVWVPCETCHGTRYQRETLEIRYKSKSIADVLDMTVSQALEHFANVPKLRRLLQTLADVGLGYLPLGQSAPTLSGGEAQRVKLAAELGRPNTGKTLYLLDEPTTGLHFDDLRKLLDVLHRLVDLGNTVICIEHNLDVIKTADWVIDLGPEAGDAGGGIVAEGPPEAVAEAAASHTGRFLREVLAAGPHVERKLQSEPEWKRGARSKPEWKRGVDSSSERERGANGGVARIAAEPPEPESEQRIKMPWERDGHRWHTQQRTSRDGKPVMWEGKALDFIIDQTHRLGEDRLLPTDWYDRAHVEVKAKAPEGVAAGSVPWFLHALTSGRWLLDVLFRVPSGTFKQQALAVRFALKTLDERDDIEAYGQTSRVQIRPALGPMEQVRVLVHDRKELATPAFSEFLAAAVKAYLAHVESLAAESGGGEPWKKDGKAWHLSQKSIPPCQPKLWKPMTLATFLGMVTKTRPDARPLWDRKVFVELVDGNGWRLGKIVTNHGYALRVDLHMPRGHLTPTQVEHLGSKQEFARPGASGAELSFWFQSIDELHSDQLRLALQAAEGQDKQEADNRD